MDFSGRWKSSKRTWSIWTLKIINTATENPRGPYHRTAGLHFIFIALPEVGW